MKKNNTYLWLGGVVIIVLAGSWIIANKPQGQAADMNATSTAPTTQTANTGAKGTVIKATSNVVTIAENLSNASVFGSWLRSTGVGAKLTGAGPYTIFVPSDAAIAQLPKGTFTGLSAAGQVRFVEYHIITDRAINTSGTLAGSVMAMSRDYLNFRYGDDKIPMVNSAKVITQYKGSNGVVYLISAALIPPQKLQ